MNDRSCPCPCTMKLDLLKSADKLAFLKENWYELFEPYYISELSSENLKCASCLIQLIVKMIEDEECYCTNRDAIRLERLNMLTTNCIALNECKQELAELEELFLPPHPSL